MAIPPPNSPPESDTDMGTSRADENLYARFGPSNAAQTTLAVASPPPPPVTVTTTTVPSTPSTTVTTAYPAPTGGSSATPPRRSGCFWGIFGALGCLVILIAPFVLAIVLGVTSVNNLIGGVTNIFSNQPPRARIDTTQTLVTSIQPMGQLVSVSVQMAKADMQVGIEQGVLNACGYSANHVAQGAIEAGIDLTSLDDSDVRYDAPSNTYTVRVPAPQLTSCRIDYIRQYSSSTTVCSVDRDEARLLANYTAIQEFRDDAIEGGILTRAQAEAELILGNFITFATGANIVIEFEPATQNILPVSCAPEVPAGWSINASTGGWTK